MLRKRAHSVDDDQAEGSRLKRIAQDRHFLPLQLSSPPPESLSPKLIVSAQRLQHTSSSAPKPTALQETRIEQSALSLPLTQQNLLRLEQSLRGDSETMPSSPSRRSRSPEKSATNEKLDSKDKLQLFSIFYEERTSIPAMLKQHVSDLRKLRQASSPNAKRIEEIVPVARSRSEQDGIDILEETLLLAPSSKGGQPYVERAAKANLSASFLPSATSFAAEGLRLETPQPDHCFGYIPSKKARPARLQSPFTIDEENIMNRFALTAELYFPFFTAQWKSPAKGQTHHQAIPQGARDGSTIVNYLHHFYTTARPSQAPNVIETCHFSATIDMRSIVVWVHWREQDESGSVSYHMEQVESGMLDKERDNREIRTILRNLQDYALEDRLKKIKELLPAFWEHSAKPRQTDTRSIASSVSGLELVPALPPPTPSSEASEPVRKRKRELE